MADTMPLNLRIDHHCLFVDDQEHNKVILQHNARPGLRPYIHPLRIAQGTRCLTEDSPWHHPWQHGIQTGFHAVNDCDFWLDPGQHPSMVIGRIEPSRPRILGVQPASWLIEAIWRHAEGNALLVEQQRWALGSFEGEMFLDLAWTLQAIPDVRIAQSEYGGLFIRMPLRRSSGASVLNAAGQRDDATEQQAAAWLHLYMPLENSAQGGGITVLDHPSNPDHPTYWRVDQQRGINPSPCIPQAIHLNAGQALQRRYRLLLHSDPPTAETIQSFWQAYAQEEAV